LECWYDGNSRRIAKREVVNGQTNAVQYVWDGWTLVAVLDQQGRLLEYYTRGLGLAGDIGSIIGETRFSDSVATNTYYYHHNHRGDITTVREDTATIATLDYTAYGAIRSLTGAYTPRLTFSSKEFDSSTGLGYWGYRYYSIAQERWISRDPIAESGSLNLFVFCANNSVLYIDLIGLIYGTGNPVSGPNGPVGPSVPYIPNPTPTIPNYPGTDIPINTGILDLAGQFGRWLSANSKNLYCNKYKQGKNEGHMSHCVSTCIISADNSFKGLLAALTTEVVNPQWGDFVANMQGWLNGIFSDGNNCISDCKKDICCD
jgi:RHS repeat-associated protein